MSEEKVLPIYRKVQVLKPHCPICKKQLQGNNSYMSPWNCKCGKWEYAGDISFKINKQ